MRHTIYLKGIMLVLLTSCQVYANSFWVDHSLNLSAALGYSQFSSPSDQVLRFSDQISDLLLHNKQKHHPSYMLSAKRQLNLKVHKVTAIHLGPALYFQKSQYSGDIWELFSPEFFNYQARYGTSALNVMLEADVYFNPITQLTPFISLGLGFSALDAYYDDYALSNIPLNSEKHWSRNRIKPAVELGAGLSYPLQQHLALSLRYTYFYIGNLTINSSPNVSINASNQNLFVGLNYTV